MNIKNIASQAFQMPPLAPAAAPPQAPVTPAAGAQTAAPAAGSSDATSIRATGARSTLGLMTSARDQIVGDFRSMFGDVVRANARLESANQALGTAIASGDQAAIRTAAQGVTSALGDLQKNLQRLPGEVAKLNTLPPGVKDVYTGHLEEIGRIAGNLGSLPGSSGQPAGGVQAGRGEPATPTGESQATAKPDPGSATPSAPAKAESAETASKGGAEVGNDLKAQKRERRFQKLDKDGDGVLSADEIGNKQKLLRRDLDGDGQVSREEFLKGPVKRGEARPEAAQPASAAGSPVPAAGAETPTRTEDKTPVAAGGGLPPTEGAMETRFKALLTGLETMQQAASTGNLDAFTAARDGLLKDKQAILDAMPGLSPERRTELQGKLDPILAMLKPMGL